MDVAREESSGVVGGATPEVLRPSGEVREVRLILVSRRVVEMVIGDGGTGRGVKTELRCSGGSGVDDRVAPA